MGLRSASGGFFITVKGKMFWKGEGREGGSFFSRMPFKRSRISKEVECGRCCSPIFYEDSERVKAKVDGVGFYYAIVCPAPCLNLIITDGPCDEHDSEPNALGTAIDRRRVWCSRWDVGLESATAKPTFFRRMVRAWESPMSAPPTSPAYSPTAPRYTPVSPRYGPYKSQAKADE